MVSLLIIFHCTYIQTKFVQGALKYIQGLKVKKRYLERKLRGYCYVKSPQNNKYCK